MPSTINGVGTHYYGQKNLRVEKGYCESCKKHVELKSYETRLWFVILFVPIIPLGRKQIIDYCPKCTRHRAMPLDDWEKLRGEATSEALKEFAEKPDEADAAIGAHATFAQTGMTEDASKLAGELRERFVHNAKVLMYLGAWHERIGQAEKADDCFAAALAADPEDPHARRAAAMGCIAEGKLKRAADLLTCMEKPGDHREPVALYQLGKAYQAKGEHVEALKTFATVIRLFPDLAKDKKFRKTVQASEKAEGANASLLPAGPSKLKPVLGWSIAVAVLVTVLFCVNSYVASHRKLHLVNMLPVAATVRVDGQEATWRLSPMSHEIIKIPEGQRVATVEVVGRSPERVEFPMGSGFAERFFGDDVRVLNVGRGAVLLWEQTVYTSSPDSNAPSDYRLLVGDSVVWQRDIHYPFEPFPDQISTDSSRVVKRRLSILRQPPSTMIQILSQEKVDPGLRLGYLETHLLAAPNNQVLLGVYLSVASSVGSGDRAEQFLKSGLERRPVAVEWHRTYQTLQEKPDTVKALRATYDGLLATHPNDSALHYLKARVSRDSETRIACLRKAMELDEKNTYPVFAMAYEMAGLGRLDEALEFCEKAIEMGPDQEKFRIYRRDLLMAAGKWDLLESELDKWVANRPDDWMARSLIMQLRLRKGDEAGAEKSRKALLNAVGIASKDLLPFFETWSKLSRAYMKGDMAEYARVVTAAPAPQRPNYRRVLYLDQGKPARAADFVPQEKLTADSLLEASMAWSLAGNEGKARSCVEAAFEKLQTEKDDGAHLHAIWRENGAEGVAERMKGLSIQPERRRLVCTAVAGLVPADKRASLIADARRCNFRLGHPQRLVARCLDALDTK